MISPGLVSVTFRDLPVDEVVRIAGQAGLKGIEWGGDIHVPPGDFERARKAKALTESEGLEVVSYGSYYRATSEGLDAVFETAQELGAPAIRVWAGTVDSALATDEQFSTVSRELARAGVLAEAAGLDVNVEFHRGTLTGTAEAAVRLIRSVDHPRVRLYWQPDPHLAPDARLESLRTVLPHLTHVHVFHWLTTDGAVQRRPLHEGAPEWTRYLSTLAETQQPRFALMEFVEGDSPQRFLEDAETLSEWLSRLGLM